MKSNEWIRNAASCLVVGGLLAAAATAHAGLMDQDALTGDWGGKRSSMADKGINFEAVYTGEYFLNNGGAARGDGYLDNKDVTLELDGETLMGINGATLFFYVLGNEGGDPSRYVGDAQATSNIETDSITWKLYEAWWEQRFGGSYSAKFGLIDLNSEFDVTETAGLFLNSSHGIGPDFSQSGNGPSIFPTTSLALRLSAGIGDSGYAQLGIFDGVSGDVNNGEGTQVELHPGKEGWLVAAEAGLAQGLDEDDDRPFQKLALGYWMYTEDVAAADTVTGVPETGSGFYVIADRAFSDRLSAFVRFGMANDSAYGIGSYLGTGVVLTGLMNDEDQLGLGIAHAMIGDALATADPTLEAAETNIELSYQTALTPWLTVKPDIQYVIAPSADPALDNAVITSVRFEAAF
ncbi:MAG: carbohydrate porin [Nitrospirota bacterium]|nr:carbohydrate porin [Nitrospirota bacterium]